MPGSKTSRGLTVEALSAYVGNSFGPRRETGVFPTRSGQVGIFSVPAAHLRPVFQVRPVAAEHFDRCLGPRSSREGRGPFYLSDELSPLLLDTLRKVLHALGTQVISLCAVENGNLFDTGSGFKLALTSETT